MQDRPNSSADQLINQLASLVIENKVSALANEIDQYLATAKPDNNPFSLSHPNCGTTLLGLAASMGHIEIMEQLLRVVDINQVYDNNERGAFAITALFEAIHFHQLPAIKLLLAHGANVNHMDEQGYTGLHFAAVKDLATAELLIEAGADLAIQNFYGNTPAHIGQAYNMAELFLKQRANFSLMNMKGETPADIAVKAANGDFDKKIELDTGAACRLAFQIKRQGYQSLKAMIAHGAAISDHIEEGIHCPRLANLLTFQHLIKQFLELTNPEEGSQLIQQAFKLDADLLRKTLQQMANGQYQSDVAKAKVEWLDTQINQLTSQEKERKSAIKHLEPSSSNIIYDAKSHLSLNQFAPKGALKKLKGKLKEKLQEQLIKQKSKFSPS